MRDECRSSPDAHCLRHPLRRQKRSYDAAAQCMRDSIAVWQLEWWKETNLFKALLATKEDELHNLCLCHTGLCPLCLCAYARMYSSTHAGKATRGLVLPSECFCAGNACVHTCHCIFYDPVCVWACIPVLPERPPIFDVASLGLKR